MKCNICKQVKTLEGTYTNKKSAKKELDILVNNNNSKAIIYWLDFEWIG